MERNPFSQFLWREGVVPTAHAAGGGNPFGWQAQAPATEIL